MEFTGLQRMLHHAGIRISRVSLGVRRWIVNFVFSRLSDILYCATYVALEILGVSEGRISAGTGMRQLSRT
jgi:hypothetical protein